MQCFMSRYSGWASASGWWDCLEPPPDLGTLQGPSTGRSGLRRASGRGLWRSLELEAVQPRRERPLQRARRMHEEPGGPALAVPRPSRGRPRARSRSAGPSSPAPLVVEEEHEEELLVGLGLHVLADLQHVQRRGRDGDPVVVARHARHLRVNDLHREGARSRHRRQPEGQWARRDPATPQPRDPDTPTP